MNYSLWGWLVFAEMVLVEFPLAIVAWGAVTNLFYISPTTALVWRIVAFIIDLIAWLVLVYIGDPEAAYAGGTARTRGSAPERTQNAYFIVPLCVHLLIISLWIPHTIQFSGLTPLNFFTNIDAFGVLRTIETIGLLLFGSIVAFWFYESRHTRLYIRISQGKSARSASSTSATSTGPLSSSGALN